MPRGYEPEDFLTPRDASAEREPATEQSSRDQIDREQAFDDGSAVATQNHDRYAASRVELRTIHEIRGRTYRLRNSETTTMVELAKFRAIAREDLAEFAYGGDRVCMRPDIENLMRQGLIEMKSIPHEEMGSRKLLTLTKIGHRFLIDTQSAGKGQVLYHGFTKPREANHDADLYRLYQKAAEKIEGQGGRNLRVVLDYEMKKRLYRDLANLGPGRASSEQKHLVAERHGLQVVRGKIPVPDIRIEYEARDGERARVDLELATSHYRGRNMAEKVRAGFSIYAHAEDASKLRRILDQRELTAEILSL
jgi:hypothetical protein